MGFRDAGVYLLCLAMFASCSMPAAVARGDELWFARLRSMPDFGGQVRHAVAASREADLADARGRAWLGTPFDHGAARGHVVATLGDRVVLALDPGFAACERGLLVAVYDEAGFQVAVCCVEILADHALGQVAFAKPGAKPSPGDWFVARTRRAFWPSSPTRH